jgi:hypothetical protein
MNGVAETSERSRLRSKNNISLAESEHASIKMIMICYRSVFNFGELRYTETFLFKPCQRP